MYSTGDDLLKLTLAVYRVTDKFPENEPLKYFIREAAGRIFNLAASPNGERSRLEADTTLLKNYFFIAKTQNWVSERNFLALEREYDKVIEYFDYPANLCLPKVGAKNGEGVNNKVRRKKENRLSRLNLHPDERKQKIANIIKEREKIAFAELVSSFPQISRRTLIRDLQNLLREEAIKKEGNGKSVVYRPNGGTNVALMDK